MPASGLCRPECNSVGASGDPLYWLIPIVTMSGFAGLGYEIVWTREISLALGSDMMAVLGAVAGFFGGLAVGAFALDGPIRRAKSSSSAYAALEIAIGLWGLVNIWLLPQAGRMLASILGTEPAPAVLWAASFVLPGLVLLPATAAMGGTLAALERMTRQAHGGARVSAGVYGANTAGGVAGTLVSTLILLPNLGLSGTLLGLSSLNFVCAFAALQFRPAASQSFAEDAGVAAAPPALSRTRLGLTLFATGFLGIAFEVLVVRIAAQVMQNTIYTFAGLLAAYLLGTAAGGLAWQRCGRTMRDHGVIPLLAVTALGSLSTALLAPYITGIADAASAAGVTGELVIAIALFFLPSAAMGALFGYLAQSVREDRGSLGWAVGTNAAGAALAPLATALVLLPGLGVWKALLAVSAGYLLLLPWRRAALVWSAVPAALAGILLASPAPSLIRVPPGGKLLTAREGPMVTASVVDDASAARYLVVNGRFRMGGTNSVRSDYRQAVLPMLLHPAPKQALFLGLGTGATLVGGAQMPGVSVHGVELSPEVVELLPWFAAPGANAPAPRVTVADARRYISADTSHYDVIVADLFHPALDGSGSLYTSEHFAAVRKRLAPGGVFCQWLPLYQLDQPSLRAIIRTFLDIYPGASAWLNHYSVRTPMLALIGPRDGGFVDLNALAGRLGDPRYAAVMRPLGFDQPIDVLGQFLGGPRTLAAYAGDGQRNSDDYPFVTFDANRNVQALTAPPWALLLAVTKGMRTDPAELLQDPKRDELGPRLSAYWRARNQFLEAGASLPGEPRGNALVDAASPGLLDAVRLSPEFEPAYGPLIAMAQALSASDRASAERLLNKINEAAPSRAEARTLLSRIPAQ